LTQMPSGPSRLPWRGLALLTLAVLLAHLALLATLPLSVGPRPSPLADTFITRTIVIAPPPAPEPAAAPAPPPRAKPAPPKPRPPQPVARPRPPAEPEPQPELQSQAESVPASPLDSTPPDVDAQQPPADAGSAPAAQGNASGTGAGDAAGGDQAAGTIAGPVALRIPGSVRLAFAATAQQGTRPMQGVFGELVWLQDGTHYDADLSWTFLFKTLRSQHSTGAIGPTGIEPLRYSDTRKTEVASHFVRDQGKIVFSNNAPSTPLRPGAQDRLSVMMQLGGLLAGDPAHYPPGTVISMQTVGPKDAEIWSFTVGEEETLSLPAGQFQAVKLTRNPRQPFDDKIELWLAPSLGWLPVRVRQTQTNGDFIDLQMRNQDALAPQAPGS
ncbi:MAG TPA: DUF3108 domain-containing protein, partial [Variovorax sp.]